MTDALYRFLGSLGYGFPLHPATAAVPTGLVVGLLALFAVAVFFKRRQLLPTARQLSILALAFAFPAILFGVLDWIHFYRGALMPAIWIKMGLSAALLILLGLGVIIGSEVKSRTAAMGAIYVCAFLAVAGLGYSGASIVYAKGPILAEDSRIGVAEAAEAVAPGAGGPASDGKALFESNCMGCHPEGGNAIVAALPVKGSKKLASLRDFETFLRAPAMPDGKAGEMPPFGEDSLEEGQAKALYDFVKAEFK